MKIKLLFLSFLLISATPTIINDPEILQFAKQSMPHQGPLKKTEDGFVYVKVPNEYIVKALNYLKECSVEAPAYFGQGRVGAHITVIETEESKGKRFKLPPLGTMIPFEIVNFSSVDVTNENGSKRIYMFTVNAPELEKIRMNNGLSPKLRGNEFHITVAIEYLDVAKR